jgi:arginyl-tRNA synthetase
MFEAEQKKIETIIQEYCRQNDIPEGEIRWTWIPFSGRWGISPLFFN